MIKLLTKPTDNMLISVRSISSRIAKLLRNYDSLNENEKIVIESFLFHLVNLKGQNEHNAIISLGSFDHKPSRNEVIKKLENFSRDELPIIMHIHFKFALVVFRNIPLVSTPQHEPIGEFKKIVKQLSDNDYRKYMAKISTRDEDSKFFRSYLSDKVIRKSTLYTNDKSRGRSGIDYSNKIP